MALLRVIRIFAKFLRPCKWVYVGYGGSLRVPGFRVSCSGHTQMFCLVVAYYTLCTFNVLERQPFAPQACCRRSGRGISARITRELLEVGLCSRLLLKVSQPKGVPVSF